MPTIGSFDILFYTLSFIVPGFVLSWMLATLVPQRKLDAAEAFLRYLTLSCLNYAVWSGIIFFRSDSQEA